MVEVRGKKERKKKHTADPNKRAAVEIETLTSVIGKPSLQLSGASRAHCTRVGAQKQQQGSKQISLRFTAPSQESQIVECRKREKSY